MLGWPYTDVHRLRAALAIGTNDDVVELAPGMGATTELVLARRPASYVGVDRDPVAATGVEHRFAGPGRRVINASAADTGLDDGCAGVVFGEAYLTMQPASQKRRIIAELARITRPGGRMGLHEIAFAPDDLDPERCDAIAGELRTTIKVSVSPCSIKGWCDLLDEAGLEVTTTATAPFQLLEPRRASWAVSRSIAMPGHWLWP